MSMPQQCKTDVNPNTTQTYKYVEKCILIIISLVRWRCFAVFEYVVEQNFAYFRKVCKRKFLVHCIVFLNKVNEYYVVIGGMKKKSKSRSNNKFK